MDAERGQALVEMALVTPLLLLLILGALQIGLAMVWRMQVTHVAQQAVAVAAREGCEPALDLVPDLLGRMPSEAECESGELVSVLIRDRVPMSTPWWTDMRVAAIARAVPNA